MNCILRRPSGVYVARLAVPKSLRHIVGKSELIATTHQRDLRLAKVVGASIIARWRSWLLSLRPTSASTQMDILRIATGHPALSTLGDYLNLSECLAYAGLERSEALEAAAAGKLDMFVRLASCRGHIVPWDSLERYDNDGDAQVVIPQPNQLPAEAARVVAGEFRIHRAELRSLALALKSESKATVVALDDPRLSAGAFIPEAPIHITSSDVLVSAEQLERLRRAIQETISPQLLQVEQAREARTGARRQAEQAPMKISAAIHEYMGVRAVACRDDQARRIRSALDLLVELIGDHGIQDIDSSMLSDFRNTKLPEVPADENKVRLRLGTKSVSESITALRNSEYKRISANEQLKRLQWIKSFFDWLEDREWIDRNPAKLLVAESRAKAVARREAERGDSQREKFSSAHLSGIFSHGTWFQTGQGILTRADTYREYCPYYYWLPLLGLYTGARINELAQLDLADIKLTANGTAYVSIAELDDEDLKRRKNLQSRRDVALHPHLLQLGFMPWVQALAEEGHTRLFPELKHDAVKGYGKAATKWFSRYLATLGWPRDGSLVFHSFRSTLATACINDLRLTIAETAQISGHREGKQSILERHYLKGADIDSQVALISRLDFKLPPIAQFEIGAGLKAIRDALRRKR